MTNAEITKLATVIALALSAGKASKPSKKATSFKAANKFEPKGKILSEGKTERQLKNDVNVAKAFKKQGIVVTPRVDALTYKGWLSKGMRVVKGEHGTWVKGVGTLFHSGQVAPDVQPSKAEMTAEVAAMQPAVA